MSRLTDPVTPRQVTEEIQRLSGKELEWGGGGGGRWGWGGIRGSNDAKVSNITARTAEES